MSSPIEKTVYKYIFFLIFIPQTIIAQQIFRKEAILMGVDFEFAVVAEDEAVAQYLLDTAIVEVQRVEQLISSWDNKSQTSQINRMAGLEPVSVDRELFQLIKRSLRVSRLTHGYFDISFASIDKYWHFDGTPIFLPDSLEIARSVEMINYQNIVLDEAKQTVFLKEKGMRIGFGAIGKGYVAEKVKELWKSKNVVAGLINASGDLTCFGNHPQTKAWKIAITHPENKNESVARFDLTNSSVVTSGNYEKFVLIDGKKYTHIINPKTGWPVEGLKSVSIFCSNTELADALATSVFVIGKDEGIDLINQLKGVEALLIDEDNNIIKSENLEMIR